MSSWAAQALATVLVAAVLYPLGSWVTLQVVRSRVGRGRPLSRPARNALRVYRMELRVILAVYLVVGLVPRELLPRPVAMSLVAVGGGAAVFWAYRQLKGVYRCR